MINLFNIEDYRVDSRDFNHVLHDGCVKEFEHTISEYVGAKYSCGVSSATNALFLALQNKNTTITIPSIIPPVVANAVITSGNKVKFKDDIEWVGDSYILHSFGDYKIIDSAQKLEKDQFKKEANDQDLMIFSFYPTKPVGSIDGGMVVSNDKEKIDWFREATLNGTGYNNNNWERVIKFPGWKMYLNSVQAYVANENFKKYKSKLESLAYIRDYYNNELNDANTSNHLYRVRVENNKKALNALKEVDIACGIHYNCLHEHPVYQTGQTLEMSEKESIQTLSIPFHEQLTQSQLEHIVKSVKKTV